MTFVFGPPPFGMEVIHGFSLIVNSANLPECIQSCTLDERYDKIAGCAYICEMTHGYENREFLDTIGCLVESECLMDYPRDGVCLGEDKDALQNIKSLEQVRFSQSLCLIHAVWFMRVGGEKGTDTQQCSRILILSHVACPFHANHT